MSRAQRAYMDMAAGVARECPGWDVTWDLEGFSARNGTRAVGPVPDPSGIVALVRNAW